MNLCTVIPVIMDIIRPIALIFDFYFSGIAKFKVSRYKFSDLNIDSVI